MSIDKFANPYQINIEGELIRVPKSLGMTAEEMKDEILRLDKGRKVKWDMTDKPPCYQKMARALGLAI
tara:strand:- start:70 stop:273 length:204 start_codon:yes stop_codon:yes gene_type:complete